MLSTPQKGIAPQKGAARDSLFSRPTVRLRSPLYSFAALRFAAQRSRVELIQSPVSLT
jgi:hypothetical protein